MRRKQLLLTVSILIGSFSSGAQAQSTQDPQALALAAKSLAVLTGGAQVNDVTLAGTATRIAGSDAEDGSVTLKALGTGESRLDLNLANGTRSEVRSLSDGAPQGYWMAPDGSFGHMAQHNCQTDAAWFFPAFSVLYQISNPNVVVTYVGEGTKNEIAVQHLHFSQTASSSADPSGLAERLAAEDIYLNASSLVPVALTFNTHPDNDALTNIPVEVDFSDYRAVNGVAIPFRIQKFFNGTLLLDITVQSAVLNSGLTDADFTAR